MRLSVILRALALAALGVMPATASAQDTLPPWEGGLTHSLGQPPRLRLRVGGSFGVDYRLSSPVRPLALGSFGVSRSITNPVTGLLGWSAEAFGGFSAGEGDGGIRLLLESATLRLSGGAEYDIRDSRIYPVIAVTAPVRRAGIFRGGTLVRLEWLPGAGSQVRATVLAPVGQPAAGRTRPRTDRVTLAERRSTLITRPPDAQELDRALANVAVGMRRTHELIVPYLDAPGPDPEKTLAPLVSQLLTQPNLPGYHSDGSLNTEGVVRIYHAELARAFSIAATGKPIPVGETTPLGDSLTSRARTVLLDHVLFPFNRLLGQKKSDGTLRALSAYARGNFTRELHSAFLLTPDREEAVLYVFQFVLETMEAERVKALREWRDSRVLWLPLQYALLPEDHDTQAELDQLVERAVGRQFTDGNSVVYVINEQFQREVSRSIHDARDYHVLWIHDFRGRNDRGEPDALSLRYVVDAYLHALTASVREYDERRVLPAYMIFLDQHYYEVNKGRLWLDLLERPLYQTPRLPRGFEGFEETIRRAQAELRAAVDSSHLLQAEVRQYGKAWLDNLVKVHVSVTNPADESFWSKDILPLIGMPDNIMRDHRKIAFYDVSEDDPYRGWALYTGMGIGEHYAGATWEDRSIVARGPVTLTLKEQARRLLLSQGLSADQIPAPLRPREKASNYAVRVHARIDSLRELGERDQRAMELHNGTGYQDKPINVARATLYTLMPRGSVVKVPDSLWGSAIYASLLTGSAFRGVRVLFIAPALPSAPSSGWPQMGLAHDLFARLIVLQQVLGPELEAGGGMLKTGIYNPGIGVQDALSRFGAAYQNARRTPFLRRLFPIHESLDSMFTRMSRAQPPTPLSSAHSPTNTVSPKLHLKANFFASREAWDSLVTRPEMLFVLQGYIEQLAGCPEPCDKSPLEMAKSLRVGAQALVDAFQSRLSPADRERIVYYLVVGSANMDYRSMFMDGEASVLMSGWSSVVSLIDFGLLVNLSVWVDDLHLLDALLPPPSAAQRRLARRARPAL